MTKTPLIELIELKTGKGIRELIREREEQKKTRSEQAKELGIPVSTLRSIEERVGARFGRVVWFDDEDALIDRGILQGAGR